MWLGVLDASCLSETTEMAMWVIKQEGTMYDLM